ncbi:MAG: hypothetical protein AAF519_14625 [Bacteroidota bacterium]
MSEILTFYVIPYPDGLYGLSGGGTAIQKVTAGFSKWQSSSLDMNLLRKRQS